MNDPGARTGNNSIKRQPFPEEKSQIKKKKTKSRETVVRLGDGAVKREASIYSLRDSSPGIQNSALRFGRAFGIDKKKRQKHKR